MRVEVIRAPGDKYAPDIIDELCTADNVGRERGRNYLDENGFDKALYELSLSPVAVMPATGITVAVADASLGETFRGKLIGWSITVSQHTADAPVSIQTQLSIERSL
jgi:hypothetical protein